MHHFLKYSTITIFLFATTNNVNAFNTHPSLLKSNPNTAFVQSAFDKKTNLSINNNGMNSRSKRSALSFTKKEIEALRTELFLSDNDDSTDGSSEVDRLRSMAAKLRAEAASLEANKAQEVADATERAFRKFDIDDDGEISFDELKKGLEKILKAELDDKRVKRLMDEFDTSGDGALQREEFVSVDKFRNTLESIIRDEKMVASNAKKEAKKEKDAAVLAEARANMLNDGKPSGTDKLLSTLPYLFPLMDGLAFGRFLLADADNPAVALLALIYTIYRSIPFSGFVTIIAFSTLSGNFNINRLIRFNMQQAIYLDVALFLPAFLASIYTFVVKGIGGVQLPEVATQIGSDLIFVTLILIIFYSVGSSLLGITPDKLPAISDYTNKRMPTLDMLDEEGRFMPPQMREEEQKKKDAEDKKKKDDDDNKDNDKN